MRPSRVSRREFFGRALAVGGALGLAAPGTGSAGQAAFSPEPPPPQAASARRKFDFHVHLGRNQDEMFALKEADLPAAADWLVTEMAKHGVEKALLVSIAPIMKTEYYLTAARRHEGKLLVACSVVPRPIANALEHFKTYRDQGAVALKLQPMQYDPDDPAVERLVYEAVKAKVPVLFHHIDLPPGIPGMIYRLASRYPEGNFVVIHFGGALGYRDVLPLGLRLPNVYLETSVGFPTVEQGPLGSEIEYFASLGGTKKLIFGSEHPENYARVIESLSRLAGARVTDEELDAAFFGNAEKILGLKQT